jgi:hypothetical protein
LPVLSQLRSIYLRYLSKPQADRSVYREIRRRTVLKIVEMGVGDCRRAMRMIELAKLVSPQKEISYTGIDAFEGRACANGAIAGPSLKAAHQLLRCAPARVRLVPGDLPDALTRVANSLGKIDLLIVPGEVDSPAFARMWHFVPRMLHERSVVFVERLMADGQKDLGVKPRDEVDALAAVGVSRRAA